MRNLSVLALYLLATIGFRGACSVPYALLQPRLVQGHEGVYAVEVVNAVMMGAWLLFVAWSTTTLFAGERARRFRITTLVLVALQALWFIGGLHTALQPAQRIAS
jgi:hypothetical protein